MTMGCAYLIIFSIIGCWLGIRIGKSFGSGYWFLGGVAGFLIGGVLSIFVEYLLYWIGNVVNWFFSRKKDQ